MSHPDYAITYQPLFTTLQAIDVQALIDQAGDPWYNQTLIQVGVPPGVSRTRQGLAAPKGLIRLYDATAPARLTKRGTSPLVSEVGWPGSAPVRSPRQEKVRMDSRK